MKVVLIEDNLEIIESVDAIFELRWPDTTMLTTTFGEKGIDLVRNEVPDLVLLDLGLPDIDGFQVLRRIREFSNVPVIILTAQQEEINIIRGLELGADDYITKPFAPGELLARVRAVSRRYEQPKGKSDVSPNLIVIGKLRLDMQSREATIGNKHIKLSPRSYDLLNSLALNRGKFVPVETLTQAIAAPGEPPNETLMTYLIKRLNDEFEEEARIVDLIVGEPSKGYRLTEH